MFSNIYIIGKIPDTLSVTVQKKFADAEKSLERFNSYIYNPVTSLLEGSLSREEAIKRNLCGLMNANAVYVLNEVNSGEANLEVLMAVKLNKLILHEF
ncbi:MAG: DUF4406 domain-containing protein [Flavobacterium sp. JAD_PAG50586_2]|nr:MAG: DUF4406 domain-containing protein [Flavobacterium sp. JAD_PAG50586_2]